jgi:class 3 adenylate cyclase
MSKIILNSPLTPSTKYAKSGDVHIAYQTVGEGSLNLVLIPGWVSHVECGWENPAYSAFLNRLASFSRLVILDRRGTGLSDRVQDLPSLEQRMEDVRAVMDAEGIARAALLGLSEGGPMCMMFAATYPARTTALLLYGTFARLLRAPDYPIGLPKEAMELFLDLVERTWGTGTISSEYFGPSSARDESFKRSWARMERFAVSPAGIKALMRILMETDARSVLPIIQVPTLIQHRSDDQIIGKENARYIARHIKGAKYLEYPGPDHFLWSGDSDALLNDIEVFLTGSRQEREPNRVLVTVMFTDIVGGTKLAATLGDQRWREVLERHHAVVRQQIGQFRGREIDTAGDGFLAGFDGPARAVHCAQAIVQEVRAMHLDVRVGLHAGECDVFGDKLSGIAVHIGSRVTALAGAGEVLVSGTVRDLVAGSGLDFEDRGLHSLKGLSEKWRVYRLASGVTMTPAVRGRSWRIPVTFVLWLRRVQNFRLRVSERLRAFAGRR